MKFFEVSTDIGVFMMILLWTKELHDTGVYLSKYPANSRFSLGPSQALPNMVFLTNREMNQQYEDW